MYTYWKHGKLSSVTRCVERTVHWRGQAFTCLLLDRRVSLQWCFVVAQDPSVFTESGRKDLIYWVMILAAPASNWLASDRGISEPPFSGCCCWILGGILCFVRASEEQCACRRTEDLQLRLPYSGKCQAVIFLFSLSRYRCCTAVLSYLCDLAQAEFIKRQSLLKKKGKGKK